LDPELRMEQTGVSPVAWALLAILGGYVSIKPGVLSGFVDFYLLAPFDRATRPRLKKVRCLILVLVRVGVPRASGCPSLLRLKCSVDSHPPAPVEVGM